MKKSYLELLKDPRWQKKRLKIMEYAEFRCQICGNSRETLNVHHSYYTRGKMPWEYPDGSLICTCESCHEFFHKRKKERTKPLVQIASQPQEVEHLEIPSEKPVSIFPEFEAKLIERVKKERPLLGIWLEKGSVVKKRGGLVTIAFGPQDKLFRDMVDHQNNKESIEAICAELLQTPVCLATEIRA